MAGCPRRQLETEPILGGSGVERGLERFAQSFDGPRPFRNGNRVRRNAVFVGRGGAEANKKHSQERDRSPVAADSSASRLWDSPNAPSAPEPLRAGTSRAPEREKSGEPMPPARWCPSGRIRRPADRNRGDRMTRSGELQRYRDGRV